MRTDQEPFPAPAPNTARSAELTLPAATFDHQITLAAVVLVLTTFAFLHPKVLFRREFNSLPVDSFYKVAIYRFHLVLIGAALIAWLLEPACSFALRRFRNGVPPQRQRTLGTVAIAFACVASAAFVVVFGRWQFGGFDYNIIVDIGWRQILGQRPYVDFLTATPPFFNLGILAAFRLFGVSWNAMLFFTALFTAATLVWLFCLFRRLGMSRIAALGVTCTLEVITMLSCCFWWYNNTTLLLAAIFFLSSQLLLRAPHTHFAQASFVVSLALLALAKPNIAGVTIVGCLALLLFITKQRGRVALLAFVAAVLALLVLHFTHTSLQGMLSSYRGVAKERGPFSSFGFDEFSPGEQALNVLWYFILCLPLLSCIRPMLAELRARRWQAAAGWLFFPLSALVAVYGLRGNGELRDAEATLLVSALGLLAFALRIERLQLRRFTLALLCAMAASNLYTGMARHRVYTIGAHNFFEWQDRNHLIATGRFQHMRVSQTFVEVNDEVQQAVRANPGPFFFGPRVDYNYMLLGLPSPTHFPAWWHPGTAFDRSQTTEIIEHWKAQRFPTLIYLKTRSTYYPPMFLDAIHSQYIRDDRFPRITVYHLRPSS